VSCIGVIREGESAPTVMANRVPGMAIDPGRPMRPDLCSRRGRLVVRRASVACHPRPAGQTQTVTSLLGLGALRPGAAYWAEKLYGPHPPKATWNWASATPPTI
jgi:hypothetical protein